ncbi:hypothetical protein D3C72_1736970 [compost metagenome]
MRRVQTDEAVGRGNRQLRFGILVMGIGFVHQRLLRVAPVREARLQGFIQFQRTLIVATIQLFTRRGVDAFYRPAAGFIFGVHRGATCHQHDGQQGYKTIFHEVSLFDCRRL